jgi:hypothetical protein
MSGETYKVVNPVSDEVVAEVHAAGSEDLDKAFAAAMAAQPAWKSVSSSERSGKLRDLADLLRKSKTEIAKVRALIQALPAYIPFYFGSALSRLSRSPLGNLSLLLRPKLSHQPVCLRLLHQ